jgi:acetyl esterase
MPLHPKIAEFLKQIQNSPVKPFSKMSIAEMRQATKNFSVFQGEKEEIYKVITKKLKSTGDEYLIRFYKPSPEKKLPIIVFFHSGGFVKGDIEFCDAFCRRLANGSHAIVASVNYRLAPEHPFPSALHDGYHALCWVYEYAEEFGGNRDQIAVMGESSGGNLAAVMGLMSYSKNGPPLCFQVLVYPQLDYTHSFSSHQLFANGYFLTEEALKFYEHCYLPQGIDKTDPLVSPYFTQYYQYLPPAYIITAEYDPLRDEGEAFAHQLKKEKVEVTYHRFPGMVHGFVSMGNLVEEGIQALHMICDKLRAAFKKSGYKKSA